ncbi:hypothetical protein, partial [Aeromicrobium sp.]|uniref:hypothetical protein n=1 Tax=Aeromicrobium sp. TaxID=1871063 RepID=UPI0025BA5D9C
MASEQSPCVGEAATTQAPRRLTDTEVQGVHQDSTRVSGLCGSRSDPGLRAAPSPPPSFSQLVNAGDLGGTGRAPTVVVAGRLATSALLDGVIERNSGLVRRICVDL